MTIPPESAPGQVPGPGPGWYPDPAGSGRLHWWDGSAWTGQPSGQPQSAPRAPRPEIDEKTPVYNPFIWIMAALPVLPLIFLLLWNPVVKFPTIGIRQRQPVDPASIFTTPFLLLVAAAWLAYLVSVLLAYLDWDKLRRDGVVRPFHWVWALLKPYIYVIGRSVIVRKVAPGRGLAPVWAVIGVTAVLLVIAAIKVSVVVATMSGQLATM